MEALRECREAAEAEAPIGFTVALDRSPLRDPPLPGEVLGGDDGWGALGPCLVGARGSAAPAEDPSRVELRDLASHPAQLAE